MKLLIVTPKVCYRVEGKSYSIGGSPAEFNALASRCELFLLASFEDRESVDTGWQVIDPSVQCFSFGPLAQLGSFPPPVGAMRRCIHETRKVLRSHKFDIILLKGPSEVSMAPINLLKSSGIPVVYHYSLDWLADVSVSRNSSILRQILSPYFWFVAYYRRILMKHYLARADALATVSSHYAAQLTPYHQRPILLLRETFTTSSRKIVRKPAERLKRANRFLFVGRIDRNKNLQLIVRALHLLRKHRPDLSPTIEIVGKGDEYNEVAQLASNLRIGDLITHIGHVHNERLSEYYARCIALLLPSFSETLGQVIVESFSHGTPVIASRVGGIPDLVKDGINGYLIDPRDPSDLAKKMADIIDDSEGYQQLQLNALEIAYLWTREATVDHWLGTLENIRSEFAESREDWRMS